MKIHECFFLVLVKSVLRRIKEQNRANLDSRRPALVKTLKDVSTSKHLNQNLTNFYNHFTGVPWSHHTICKRENKKYDICKWHMPAILMTSLY